LTCPFSFNVHAVPRKDDASNSHDVISTVIRSEVPKAALATISVRTKTRIRLLAPMATWAAQVEILEISLLMDRRLAPYANEDGRLKRYAIK